MLNGERPFPFLRPGRVPGRDANVPPPGLQVVAAEPRHLRRARQIVAAAPVMNVHVGAHLPASVGEPASGLEYWALLEGPRTIGLVQQHRGVCWALEPGARGDARLAPAVAGLLARTVRFSEIVFGVEDEVRAVIDACRTRGIDLLELRRQEMMACVAPDHAAAPPPNCGFALRPGLRRDLRWLLEAHGAMCREDLGVDQVARNPEGYARYFQDLIRRRRVFVGEFDGRPVFKAEVAQESREAWLIEGVYTAPGTRGRGFAKLAMVILADAALARGRISCLYVHRRNEIAIGVYRRIGYETVSPWATAILTRDSRRSVRATEY